MKKWISKVISKARRSRQPKTKAQFLARQLADARGKAIKKFEEYWKHLSNQNTPHNYQVARQLYDAFDEADQKRGQIEEQLLQISERQNHREGKLRYINHLQRIKIKSLTRVLDSLIERTRKTKNISTKDLSTAQRMLEELFAVSIENGGKYLIQLRREGYRIKWPLTSQ